MSNEYAAALEAHNAASKAYRAVVDAYRAREVGDAEYLAARSDFERATAVYDAAFAKEAGVSE